MQRPRKKGKGQETEFQKMKEPWISRFLDPVKTGAEVYSVLWEWSSSPHDCSSASKGPNVVRTTVIWAGCHCWGGAVSGQITIELGPRCRFYSWP
jgi:hypothetical protein